MRETIGAACNKEAADKSAVCCGSCCDVQMLRVLPLNHCKVNKQNK